MVVLMGVWVGGLATYGAMLLPVLHARLTVAGTAPITRQFTAGLNALGLATLLLWALGLSATRRDWSRRAWWSSWALLAASAGLLVVEFGLHTLLSRQMQQGQTSSEGFYPLHRIYLIASSLQWLVNLGLIGVAMSPGLRRDLAAEGPPRDSVRAS
jgi:hypothetical protein